MRSILTFLHESLPSTGTGLRLKTRYFAHRVTKDLDKLKITLVKGESVIVDYNNALEDRDHFFRDNANVAISQSVSSRLGIKRASYVLLCAVLLTSIFSLKGYQFLLTEFYKLEGVVWASILAFFVAFMLIHASIYLNHFLSTDSNERPYNALIRSLPYMLVLIVPIANLMELFDSSYSPLVRIGTIAYLLIDVYLHFTLIRMSPIFIHSKELRKAVKVLSIKDKRLAACEAKLQHYRNTLTREINQLTDSARSFYANYTTLSKEDNAAAQRMLSFLDNFARYIVNNKVIGHEAIPYITNEDGQPVITPHFYLPNLETFSQAWEYHSTIRNYQLNRQPNPIANNAPPAYELPGQAVDTSETQQPTVAEANLPPANNIPEDYSTFLDNTQEKYL